jgi:hypothetical protein
VAPLQSHWSGATPRQQGIVAQVLVGSSTKTGISRSVFLW